MGSALRSLVAAKKRRPALCAGRRNHVAYFFN
jgi:hypothetical protein